MAASQQSVRFDQLVKQHELPAQTARDLFNILSKCLTVMVCDDSGSMLSEIKEVSGKLTTRWMELKRLAAVAIDYVTAVNPIEGLDLVFLNRGTVNGVKTTAGLQEVFADPPQEEAPTPLVAKLQQVFDATAKYAASAGREVLVVVVTDGVPSEGHKAFEELMQRKPSNVHVSVAEMTDRPEDMEWLDELDKTIPRYDATADYREELEKVRKLHGQSFVFTMEQYVIKILLASFLKQWQLDRASSVAQCTCSIL